MSLDLTPAQQVVTSKLEQAITNSSNDETRYCLDTLRSMVETNSSFVFSLLKQQMTSMRFYIDILTDDQLQALYREAKALSEDSRKTPPTPNRDSPFKDVTFYKSREKHIQELLVRSGSLERSASAPLEGRENGTNQNDYGMNRPQTP